MRAWNLILTSIVGAFALLLLVVALPTYGERPLAHWALNVGAYTTVLATALIYLLVQLRTPQLPNKSHVIILLSYLSVTVLSAIGGAFWGVVGHAMETEHLLFATALPYAVIPLLTFYSLALLTTLLTVVYVRRISNRQISDG
jgi:hypothetical protein